MGVGSTLRHIQKSNATADGVDEEGTHYSFLIHKDVLWQPETPTLRRRSLSDAFDTCMLITFHMPCFDQTIKNFRRPKTSLCRIPEKVFYPQIIIAIAFSNNMLLQFSFVWVLIEFKTNFGQIEWTKFALQFVWIFKSTSNNLIWVHIFHKVMGEMLSRRYEYAIYRNFLSD